MHLGKGAHAWARVILEGTYTEIRVRMIRATCGPAASAKEEAQEKCGRAPAVGRRQG